ncbi:MAG TPA: DUF2461 domain-containing protein [Candidatus Acidoferrales bacterium]|jgi:uncharacterized protein (TIGR02453 family)|nr:DUF2461 domain-containing protein [Candidatus Acidoferrales bacterium]
MRSALMRTVFPGFPPEGLQFLRSLARHNKREWFQPRKPIFEAQVKQPMRQLVEAVNAAMAGFAPEYVADPDKAIFRIYRDTRFSKDKTPYKDHIAASFPRRGTPEGAGYYFAVSHKEVAIGGGIWMPAPGTLLAIRTHVGGHYQDFRRIAQARAVKQLFGEVRGEQLSRVPKGFDPVHPAADLLRFKQFLLYVELEPDLATGPELYAEIVKRFRALRPFLEFLNAPLAQKKVKIDPKDLFA